MIIPLEQHYRPAELAKLTGLSTDTIRDLFRDEPGVLIIDRPETTHKRGYSSMRIPASIAERVLGRHRVQAKPGRLRAA